jgi:DNA-binding CsgD family transcriptional regulator
MEYPSNIAHRVNAADSRRGLGERQVECLYWAQEGKSAGDIGQILGISGRTVDYHIAKACAALGVRTRMQAVVRARDLGLLPAFNRAFAPGRSTS